MGLRTLAAAMVFSCCGIAAAEEPISTIALTASGKEITLRLAGVPRREALARLFGESEIAIDWLDDSLAEELIGGEYRGTRDQIVASLLARTNFVIIHDKIGISRIRIAGPISAAQNIPSKPVLRKKFATLQRAAKSERYQTSLRKAMLEKIRSTKAALTSPPADLPPQ